MATSSTTTAVADRLRRASRVLLVAHRPPDADGVGSLLALGRMLSSLGKEVAEVCVEALEPSLLSLPGAERVRVTVPPRAAAWDAAVLLDCADVDRAGLEPGFLRDVTVINIDHHRTNPGFGDVVLVDPTAPATAALVVDLVDALDVPLGADDATDLYAGLLTDTERFTAESVCPATHRLAARLLESGARAAEVAGAMYSTRPASGVTLLASALRKLRRTADGRVAWISLTADDFTKAGVDPMTAEDLASVAVGVEGVWAGAYLRPGAGGVRVGLRSRHPEVDVSRVAQALGGGGHRWAAGCVLPDSRNAATRVVRALQEEVERVGG
jgi:phosphoesterase RecJ-like protein